MGDVIAVTNQSRDYAYDVSVVLRQESRRADLTASVSYGRSRDVQSPRPTSALLIDNWRFARPVAGRQDDLALGTSDFDQPFRVRASGTLHSPWRRFATALSFFYVGGSGFPFTYVAGGTQGRGDLNADGAAGNDPIYIPRTAFDTAEIRFGGAPSDVTAQQVALERFIDGVACLRDQRGADHVAQQLPGAVDEPHQPGDTPVAPERSRAVVGTRTAGVQRAQPARMPGGDECSCPPGPSLASTSQIPLLSQVGTTAGPGSQPTYRFDPTLRRYDDDNFDTYYQIQLAVRYNF